MPIVNIVDRRKRQYRFLKVNAIIEAAWHDNSVDDADQIEHNGEGPSYEAREHISLSTAIAWGQAFEAPVTLFIYDKDGGIFREDATA